MSLSLMARTTKPPLHGIRGNHWRLASDTTRIFIAAYGFETVQSHNKAHPVFYCKYQEVCSDRLEPTGNRISVDESRISVS